MPEHKYNIGDSFPLQFAWHLPEGDYIRAVFEATVIYLDNSLEKYVVRLEQLLAGRQESDEGELREVDALSADYWRMVGQIPGKRVSIAFEADDGRPLYLKLATLTGEHSFFTRLDVLDKKRRQG
ncbi:MAG: hypothetical protein KC418_02995 [Anaerolineales bacterium]|nr:hypothetical protein [Anaerolineales bacterium]MCB8951436.1 hypothetical protein [Ardenticatenales bacterium]